MAKISKTELKQMVEEILIERNYKDFFRDALKQAGVTSPDEFDSEEKKKEFFDRVDAAWKAKEETDEGFNIASKLKESKFYTGTWEDDVRRKQAEEERLTSEVPTLKDIETQMKKMDWFYEVGSGSSYQKGRQAHETIKKMVVLYLNANPKDANKITNLSKKVEPKSYYIQHSSWADHWKYGKR